VPSRLTSLAVAPGFCLGPFSALGGKYTLMATTSDGSAQPPGPSGEAEILRERERIAVQLQEEVVQQIQAVGLNLQSAASLATDSLLLRRINQAVNDLDHVIRLIRDTVFGVEHRLQNRGLRAAIVHLFGELSPAPDLTFHGPVDGTLHPAASIELLAVLTDALAVIGRRWAPVLVDVTAANGKHVTMLQAEPLRDATRADDPDGALLDGLRDRAAQAGMRIDIEPGPGVVQVSWHAA